MSVVRYLFDADLNGRIIRGVRRREPTLDTLTAHEAGLKEADDPTILRQATIDGRIVVSHDHSTMRAYAEERLRAELPMPGLFLVRQDRPIGKGIDDLVIIGGATAAEEWHGKIIFLPL